jgi:pyridoxine 5-phosphate synthase
VAVLSVNLNKVALIRNSRSGDTPSVLEAARIALAAGAAGITVHPRPDQRHIRPADVRALAELVAGYPGIEFNVEGNPFAGPRDNGYPGFDALIESSHPHQATLVPDDDRQLTSDHGWVLDGDTRPLAAAVARYRAAGTRVSLFVDPVPETISRVRDLGADRIELYTGPFAATVAARGTGHPETRAAFERYRAAARHAADIGLGVNAGHDLDRHNLQLFREIREVQEVSIGHALISDALELGLDAAVRAYVAVLGTADGELSA